MGNSDPFMDQWNLIMKQRFLPNSAQDSVAEFLFHHTIDDLRENGVNNVFYGGIDPISRRGLGK
jgi:hypothetical protein